MCVVGSVACTIASTHTHLQFCFLCPSASATSGSHCSIGTRRRCRCRSTFARHNSVPPRSASSVVWLDRVVGRGLGSCELSKSLFPAPGSRREAARGQSSFARYLGSSSSFLVTTCLFFTPRHTTPLLPSSHRRLRMLSALSGALKTLQRGLGSREVAPETADPPSKGRGCPFTGSVAAAPASGEPSLLERIGGSAALKACVDDFYGRLLQEPSLQAYLEGVDLARLKAHQYNFMRIAFTKIPDGMDVVAVIRKVGGSWARPPWGWEWGPEVPARSMCRTTDPCLGRCKRCCATHALPLCCCLQPAGPRPPLCQGLVRDALRPGGWPPCGHHEGCRGGGKGDR